MNLDDWFCGYRSWAILLELIQLLPRGGAYWAAVARDEDTARAYLDTHGKVANNRPSLRGWDTSADLLASINDRLESIRAALGAEPHWEPRPETGMEKVEKARVNNKRLKLEKYLLGG